MTDDEPEKSEKEVKSTFTDDDDEVNTQRTRYSSLLRKISEAAVGINAADQFVSGDPFSAFIFATIATIIWYHGQR